MINRFNKDDKKQIRQIKNNIINFNSIINNTVGNENKIENIKNLLDNSLGKLLHVYEKNGISIVDMIKTLKSNSDDLKVNKDILKELVCSKQLDKFIKDGINDYVSTKIDNLKVLYYEYSSLKDSIDFSKIEPEKIEENDNSIPDHEYEEYAEIFINNKDDIDWNNGEYLFALEDVIVYMQNKNKKIQEAISINSEIGHVDEDDGASNSFIDSNTDDDGVSLNSFLEGENKQFVLTKMVENQGIMIDDLRKMVKELTDKINDQQMRMNELADKNTDLQKTITETNAQNADLKNQIKNQKKDIKEMQIVIKNNKDQTERVTSFRKANNHLKNMVAKKDEQINALKNMVAKKDEQINALENMVAKKDEQINAPKNMVAEQGEHIKNLETKEDEPSQNNNLILKNGDSSRFDESYDESSFYGDTGYYSDPERYGHINFVRCLPKKTI